MFKYKDKHKVKQAETTSPAKNNPSYPFRLNFYDKPPLYEVTLEEFETCALNRLRVLAEIESSFARNRTWDELKSVTDAQCRKYLPLNSNTAVTAELDNQRRQDHLGHFVLRLAFCRSEDLRRRFVKAETTLFKVRYEADDNTERKTFLETYEYKWEKVGKEEAETFTKEILALEGKSLPPPGSKEKQPVPELYRVHWTKVPDLVAKRRVLLRGGYAYVLSKEMSSFVFNEFERNLEMALEYTAKTLPRMDEDTRLVPILNNLSQGFLAGVPSDWVNPSATGDEIRADMVDDIARKHFPMCMRNLHECLVRDHHLKYFGRLQYGLFLKILGLSIDEAMAFWRRSFSDTTEDKFNKEYKYNIRHTFGLEGRRANYSAQSCQNILTTNQPGVRDCHGCPYRHFGPENLQTALLSAYSSKGLTTTDLHEVIRLVNDGHYHVACTRVFEITHANRGVKKGEGVGGGDSVTYPNQYAARSIELEKVAEGIVAVAE